MSITRSGKGKLRMKTITSAKARQLSQKTGKYQQKQYNDTVPF